MSRPDNGLVLGTPALTSRSSAVLVTNTSHRVMTFTVRVDFRRGDRSVATATGLVADLLPGQQRAVLLYPTQECQREYDAVLIRTAYDSVRVGVERLLSEAATTSEAEAASRITFGEPEIEAGRIRVDMTNRSLLATFTVQATLLRRESLVGLATGLVSMIHTGTTRSVELDTSAHCRATTGCCSRLTGCCRGATTTQVLLPACPSPERYLLSQCRGTGAPAYGSTVST